MAFWSFPYPSQRMPVLAHNVVATSQPLAAQAGLHMLRAGGNAVDAALAAAIALTVVEPTSNGLGSDAFAIVWDGQTLQGLNASGRSPQTLPAADFLGQPAMPKRGWPPVTVPGAVSAWVALSQRYGRLPFADLFAPALRYARDGFLVSPITARAWARAPRTYADFPEFGAVFLPGGRAPRAGERFTPPHQADTLTAIADSDGTAFYQGHLAAAMAKHAAASGGWLSRDDLAGHRPDWTDTIAADYAGLTLHELPPNGQGLAALLALGILRHLDLADHAPESANALHLQIEAMKLAFADAHRYVADPGHLEATPADLLADAYLAARARLIDPARAGTPAYGVPPAGGTVYLTTADASGMMVSFIQSNFWGFGSGIVIPDTGISLQNRGYGFSTKPGHPNQVGAGKRPFHTIIPGFVMDGDQPRLSFGVMGGAMQPQGHMQMMVRLGLYGQNPQAAVDAPRWRVDGDLAVTVEAGISPATRAQLADMGHQIQVAADPFLTNMGGAQLIYRLDDGYLGASDPRKDGQAVGY